MTKKYHNTVRLKDVRKLVEAFGAGGDLSEDRDYGVVYVWLGGVRNPVLDANRAFTALNEGGEIVYRARWNHPRYGFSDLPMYER
jgi:hypothetical protein